MNSNPVAVRKLFVTFMEGEDGCSKFSNENVSFYFMYRSGLGMRKILIAF